jgi:glucosyl-dolichyl phosphate glucuronosyltransferase
LRSSSTTAALSRQAPSLTSTDPFLSIIIPTRDRAHVLASTLAALAKQEAFDGSFEIVVSDNGSTDDTKSVLREAFQTAEVPLTAVDQPMSGAAAARNAAVEAATGSVLLLLGDDTAPAANDLLTQHAALHRAHPESSFACLGKIEWSPQVQVTDFMRWLDRGGPQFHYWEIKAGWVETENYFYSSHLSMKRDAFLKAGGFDERFPFAAVEDTDLGTRLSDQGVQLEYHPDLVVWHNHPTSLEQSLRRAVRVGRCAALYNSIRQQRPHPRIKRPRRPLEIAAPIASPVLTAMARIPTPMPLRKRIWSLAHRSCYAVGYRLGPP